MQATIGATDGAPREYHISSATSYRACSTFSGGFTRVSHIALEEAVQLHLECMKEDGEEILREESYGVAVETG